MKSKIVQDESSHEPPSTAAAGAPASPERRGNLAARAVAWGSSHRKLAIGGWLAIVFLAVALIATGCGAEEEIQTEANKEEKSLLQPELDALVAAGVPGAVLVVDDPDADPITVVSGVADIESKRPVSAEDRFRIGSIAKPYVATVVLQLDEEGTLSLNDTVEKWVPGLLPNGEEIRVRDLLGHRSGLFEYEEDPRVLAPYLKGDFAYRWEPEELVGISTDHEPTAAPGTKVVYSNTNYTVLGLIVEEATGQRLGTELEQRLFKPLGLEATSFVEDAKMEAPYSRGYLNQGEKLTDVTAISPSHYWAAGNIVATAGDVARFYEALFEGELLSEDSMDEMTDYVEEAPGLSRGLGPAKGETECGSWEGHDGSVPGYNAFTRTLDSGRQVVMLMNTVTIGDTVGGPAAQKALSAVAEAAACR
jgi:D-alanyl-D-alanine carboxypeptidase